MNKCTVQAERLLEGEAEVITRKAIELAKAGDPTALKLVFDRICPLRRGRPLQGFVKRAGEGSIEALIRAVLEGEITPSEGGEVVSLIESAARVATTQALEQQRRAQLEILKGAAEKGSISGGVMLVPLTTTDEWETLAAPSQKALHAKARD